MYIYIDTSQQTYGIRRNKRPGRLQNIIQTNEIQIPHN